MPHATKPNPLFDLTGRTALVTGSSRGLGRAIAEGLGDAGAKLVINGRKADTLKQAADEMRAKGYDVLEAVFDVALEKEVEAAFERFDAEGTQIDILVNNAGIQHRQPMVELKLADWQRVIDTNLTASFLLGREAAKRMIARGHGKVINIGSLTSELARRTVIPYTVAKGGVRLLTKGMAAEWAEHGIQANAIGPGYMVTDMNEALLSDEKFDAWVKSRTPAGRWGQPDELVGAAVFLASPASNYVNGQMIYVDGGMLSVL
ncbi:gluconate 5-dehydrogenase [Fulvimarina manganoxydans]|uniref:Gluconate 5-dehydrogenase n=1 Tax=Fulvimarina manganoxydans TaxID=937218 RepID=A0A1W1YXR1_9HYPH|nr:SDR family oxidoreductase [Fulvimarina manganoxydans]SMC40985.1 gluconate 5-dehydrogenase [Fulvimarina manganoxydans]